MKTQRNQKLINFLKKGLEAETWRMGGDHGGGEGIRPRSHVYEAGEVWKGLEHLRLREKLSVSTGCTREGGPVWGCRGRQRLNLELSRPFQDLYLQLKGTREPLKCLKQRSHMSRLVLLKNIICSVVSKKLLILIKIQILNAFNYCSH